MPCPFCYIAASAPPSPSPKSLVSAKGSAYPVLSTPTIVAFLDISPIARGHTLVCPRAHREKITELTASEAAAMGFWMKILSGAIMKAVGGEKWEESSWNVLQANGTEAGQTVPHAHFHIIPRGPGGGREASQITNAERRNLVLGEGPREGLRQEDGMQISEVVRGEVGKEVERLRKLGEVIDEGEREIWLKCLGSGLKL